MAEERDIDENKVRKAEVKRKVGGRAEWTEIKWVLYEVLASNLFLRNTN